MFDMHSGIETRPDDFWLDVVCPEIWPISASGSSTSWTTRGGSEFAAC